MLNQQIKPNQKWRLGYPLQKNRTFFYRIRNAYPVSVFVIDKKNYDKAEKGDSFESFAGGVEILNQDEKFTLPNKFEGEQIFFVIENTNPMPVTVQWEAGGLIPTHSSQAVGSGW
jgi:hypothetical protein